MKRCGVATLVALVALIVTLGSALAEPEICQRQIRAACKGCEQENKICFSYAPGSPEWNACAQKMVVCCGHWASIIRANPQCAPPRHHRHHG